MRLTVLAAAALLGSSPVLAQTAPAKPTAAARGEVRELTEAVKEIAKASRENVDYTRVMPDLLYQILAKLDKVEEKLDKIETHLKPKSGN